MRLPKPKQILLLLALCFALFTIANKCSFHSLPKEKLSNVKLDIEEVYVKNTYQMTIRNLLHCPNRIYLSCGSKEVNNILGSGRPITLDARGDTTITIVGQGDLRDSIRIKFKWGDPQLEINTTKLDALPYPIGDSYKLMQGNNSSPTHNSSISRFAFDFAMSVGDTITSTQNGFVVTVIDGYHGWGSGNKWKSYGNQIMVYDTLSHLFTMYGHLKQHASFVELGDYVTIGQSLALSGKTGQTTEEHLHFNVLQADDSKSSLSSYELDSIGKFRVKELKRYQAME